MYLSSTDRIPHTIDPGVITIAYGIIIAMFVLNIIAITVVIRMEYNAAQPRRIYMDDKDYRRRVRVVEHAPAAKLAAPVTANASRDHVVDPHRVRREIEREKKGSKEKLFDFSLDSIEIESDDEKIEETQTDHLMAMNIDEAWEEFSKTNETPKPTKKKGKITRREVIGLEED